MAFFTVTLECCGCKIPVLGKVMHESVEKPKIGNKSRHLCPKCKINLLIKEVVF